MTTTAEMEFVKGLDEAKAQKILREARTDVEFLGQRMRDTKGWKVYDQARELMRTVVSEATEVRLGWTPEQHVSANKAAPPVLSLDNLKFYFYSNKARRELGL